MRILLVGEYSRLHNSLKEGLTELGHDVLILGSGDGFKNYPVDLHISHSFKGFFLKKLRTAIHKLSSIDLGSLEIYFKAKRKVSPLEKFDIVQLINESSIKTQPKYEIKFIKFLKSKCNKLFLLSCGVDYVSMNFTMNNGFKYSMLDPYKSNHGLNKKYQFQLMYLNKEYQKLHQYIITSCNGIITTDLDYHLPYLSYDKTDNYLGMVPNPINVNEINYIPIKIKNKVVIFHGINKSAVHKKGNEYFIKALVEIDKKFGDKIEIITTTDLPYLKYIKAYNSCHILLDQVYGYDQGFNALEAMSKGKVVFTGAETEWLDYYNIEEDTIAINAIPDYKSIVEKLEWLILNPKKIEEISLNARRFVEKEHDYILVANRYLQHWMNN